MLSPAELDRMRVEDRRRRARADHRRLAGLGLVDRALPDDDEDDLDDLDDAGPLDDDCLALLAAIAELLEEWAGRAKLTGAAFNAVHPRGPGGRFRSTVDRLKDAIASHVKDGKDGHPFDDFNREQLRKVAKARGIALKRGEDRDSIARKLLEHLAEGGGPKADKPAAPKKKASSAETVAAGDFSGLKRVGKQAGSNPGGVFEAGDGSRWYVKAQRSPEHAANEVLSSALYREAGVDVPQVVRGAGAPGLGDGPQTASRIVDDAKSDLEDRLGDDEYLSKLGEGFAVDAWLANWDVAGLTFDNVVSSDGDPVRIDLGGALLFRAQGEPKGKAFGDEALEWDSLRDPVTAPHASQMFGGMTPAQLADAAAKVEAVTPARIRKLVAEQGLGDDVADRLIARRADILARAKPAPSFADRIAKAVTGQEALDSVPVAKKDYLGTGLELVPDADRHAVLNALAGYQGSLYEDINYDLRSGSLAPGGVIHEKVQAIDKAMDVSPLSSDTVVYRGIRDDAIFGGAGNAGRDMTGLEFSELAYSSSSVDKRVADQFATYGLPSAPVVMRVLVPKGVKGVRLSDIGPDGLTKFSPGQEAEVLLQRDLRYRIVADSRTLVDGARRLDVEVIT